MTEAEVNKRLNKEYPKTVTCCKGRIHPPEATKKAVVYKFIETLEDLVKALDETKH